MSGKVSKSVLIRGGIVKMLFCCGVVVVVVVVVVDIAAIVVEAWGLLTPKMKIRIGFGEGGGAKGSVVG